MKYNDLMATFNYEQNGNQKFHEICLMKNDFDDVVCFLGISKIKIIKYYGIYRTFNHNELIFSYTVKDLKSGYAIFCRGIAIDPSKNFYMSKSVEILSEEEIIIKKLLE